MTGAARPRRSRYWWRTYGRRILFIASSHSRRPTSQQPLASVLFGDHVFRGYNCEGSHCFDTFGLTVCRGRGFVKITRRPVVYLVPGYSVVPPLPHEILGLAGVSGQGTRDSLAVHHNLVGLGI